MIFEMIMIIFIMNQFIQKNIAAFSRNYLLILLIPKQLCFLQFKSLESETKKL